MRKVSSPRGYKILLDIVPWAEPLKLVGCRSSCAIAGEPVSPHVAAEYLKTLWDLRRAANQPRRLSPSRRPPCLRPGRRLPGWRLGHLTGSGDCITVLGQSSLERGGVAHGNVGDRPSGGTPTRWWGLGLLALALVVCPLALYRPTGPRLASGTREPVGPGRSAGAGTL